jgi:hypothetical protein
VTADARVEDLLGELAPQVVGVLVRRYEDFAASPEDGACGEVGGLSVLSLVVWT